MNFQVSRRHAAGLLVLGLAAPRLAVAQTAPAPPAADRRAILAMAGDYRVRFEFRETVPFVADYQLYESRPSGGFETVRVIEDTGGFISLQHILVVGPDDGPIVVKHWRQDWTYEPPSLLTYAGPDTWLLRPVGEAERAGGWSQTVWQTDDSPRYGSVGRWAHDTGVSRWEGARELRPLARRDAIRNPPYDRYAAVNRHALTPLGWVHEQDNAKIGLRDGAATTFVHETALNTYTRSNEFNAAVSDAYWRSTADYWAAVRAAFDRQIAANGGIRIEEEPDNGSVTGPRLMGLADRIHEAGMATAAAIAEAQAVIARFSSAPRL